MLIAWLLALAPFAPVSHDEPVPKPPDAREVRDALKRANELILAAQEAYTPKAADSKAPGKKSGPAKAKGREWPYEGVYRVGGEIPIGYRIGGTAIAATALIEAAGGEPDAPARAAIAAGLDFVLEAIRDPLMGPAFEKGYDVRGWGHAYALGFLLRLRDARLVPKERSQEVEEAIDMLVARIQETEIGGRGGWNYSRPSGDDSDPSTFMTAPTLLVLFEARRQGEAVDAAVVERALKALEDARLATGSFQYASDKENHSTSGFEDVPGAIGRMAVCEVTLFLAERGSVERIRGSIEAFFLHWQHLEDRRAQSGTHKPPYMIAPYYFFYAHRHVAQAIEFLPEAEREGWREKLRALLWKVREDDGGWNDRVFPRSATFGTAMTVMALREPSIPRPAGWPGPRESKR
ncbi:MAG: terpene cyclase/mutase family protein [Planctomycetota bacterium]|nr:terpene cyclase/mutase family protein [Planctomycetota bacterium]